MIEVTGSKLWIINMYHEQLRKFAKVGLGKRTENDVMVTKKLIEITEKRLNQLTVVYDNSLTYQAKKLRRDKRLNGLRKKGFLNETSASNGNGTASTKSCKDIRSIGHERSKP